MWIPVNKKTGQKQPAITDAERSELMKSEFYANIFNFHAVPGSEKSAPAPVEAKTFEQHKAKEEK